MLNDATVKFVSANKYLTIKRHDRHSMKWQNISARRNVLFFVIAIKKGRKGEK